METLLREELEKARHLCRLGNFLEAYEVYEELLTTFPHSVGVHCEYAIAIDLDSGDFFKAKKLFQQALDLQPHCVIALLGLAEVYVDGYGEDSEAASLFRRVIELRPTSQRQQLIAYDGLGMLYQRQGSSVSYEEMLLAFRKEVEIAPKQAHGYENLGLALYVGGRIQESQQTLQKALLLRKELGLSTKRAELCLQEIEQKVPHRSVKFPNLSVVTLWDEDISYDS